MHLLNGSIFSYLKLPVIYISGAHHYLIFNIFERIQDRAVVTVERQYELVYELSNGAIFNDLE